MTKSPNSTNLRGPPSSARHPLTSRKDELSGMADKRQEGDHLAQSDRYIAEVKQSIEKVGCPNAI
jgi:hypothetical protein